VVRPSPRSSERPASRRDHRAVGRPLVRACSPVISRLCGQPAASSPTEVVPQRVERAVPVAGQHGQELLRHLHRGGAEPVSHPAPLPRFGRHQARLGEQGQVFGDCLPRDRQATGQVRGRIGTTRRQRGQDGAPARVGQCDEYLFGDRLDVSQPSRSTGCARLCSSRCGPAAGWSSRVRRPSGQGERSCGQRQRPECPLPPGLSRHASRPPAGSPRTCRRVPHPRGSR